MHPNLPDPARIVIAGGGVGALESVIALRALAADRVSIDLIAPEPTFAYRPLAVAEPFGLGEVDHLDLRRLLSEHGGHFESGTVKRIDSAARTLETGTGEIRAYDALILATGAHALEAVPGALTYRGEQDSGRMADVLAALKDGSIERLAFVVPPACSWPLPLYELALMTGVWAQRNGVEAQIAVITPEPEPLRVFGSEAGASVRRLLTERAVQLRTGSVVERIENGVMWMGLEGSVRVDQAVALPRVVGRAPTGLPIDARGFVCVDEFCRVGPAEDHLFAIGDMTDAEIKQGGLATQQADVCAQVIASAVGAAVDPEPFRPVLRGLLLTGEQPLYLRVPPVGDGELPAPEHDPLWWPAHKIFGRYLAPYVAANATQPTA